MAVCVALRLLLASPDRRGLHLPSAVDLLSEEGETSFPAAPAEFPSLSQLLLILHTSGTPNIWESPCLSIVQPPPTTSEEPLKLVAAITKALRLRPHFIMLYSLV